MTKLTLLLIQHLTGPTGPAAPRPVSRRTHQPGDAGVLVRDEIDEAGTRIRRVPLKIVPPLLAGTQTVSVTPMGVKMPPFFAARRRFLIASASSGDRND